MQSPVYVVQFKDEQSWFNSSITEDKEQAREDMNSLLPIHNFVRVVDQDYNTVMHASVM